MDPSWVSIESSKGLQIIFNTNMRIINYLVSIVFCEGPIGFLRNNATK